MNSYRRHLRTLFVALVVLSSGLVACGGDDGGGGGVDGGGSGIDASMSNATFTATATLDGASLSFACGPEFLAGEGNVKIYTSQIDAYSIRCRSTDGTSQVGLGFAAPAAGTTDYTAYDQGVSLGGIMDITPLNAAAANMVSDSITFTTVEAGTHLVGTFSAEWDTSNGGVAGDITGTFDLTF